jgi:hypothetical protein
MKRALKLNPTAIYAARSGIRAALPKDRSQQFCQTACYAASDATVCDQVTCWAKSIGADGRIDIYARRRLEVERGRAPAPRPRSIADLARSHYATKENAR